MKKKTTETRLSSFPRSRDGADARVYGPHDRISVRRVLIRVKKNKEIASPGA